MNHKEIGWEKLDWIDLAQERKDWMALAKAATNRQFP
jgi:hypothetical protein